MGPAYYKRRVVLHHAAYMYNIYICWPYAQGLCGQIIAPMHTNKQISNLCTSSTHNFPPKTIAHITRTPNIHPVHVHSQKHTHSCTPKKWLHSVSVPYIPIVPPRRVCDSLLALVLLCVWYPHKHRHIISTLQNHHHHQTTETPKISKH